MERGDFADDTYDCDSHRGNKNYPLDRNEIAYLETSASSDAVWTGNSEPSIARESRAIGLLAELSLHVKAQRGLDLLCDGHGRFGSMVPEPGFGIPTETSI